MDDNTDTDEDTDADTDGDVSSITSFRTHHGYTACNSNQYFTLTVLLIRADKG